MVSNRRAASGRTAVSSAREGGGAGGGAPARAADAQRAKDRVFSMMVSSSEALRQLFAGSGASVKVGGATGLAPPGLAAVAERGRGSGSVRAEARAWNGGHEATVRIA